MRQASAPAVSGHAWAVTVPTSAQDQSADHESVTHEVLITHDLTTATISDDTIVGALVELVEAGAIAGQWEFEEAAVGIVRSSADSEDAAWAAFYTNSVAELRDGSAAFSPIHQRARDLVRGRSVLEVGCCFGFLALQCAQDGYDVHACDISPGAIELLNFAATQLNVDLTATVGDATRLAYPDDAVDTVTLIHLLEHLDYPAIVQAISEALRVARQRVVIAIPYEEHPSEHFGHLSTLLADDLREWANAVDHAGSEVFDDHGGWLVLTPHPTN